MIWLTLALNYAGIALFAVTMEAHRGRIPDTFVRTKPTGLRLTGIAAQTIALITTIPATGLVNGCVQWVIGWMACAYVFTFLLALKPRWWTWPAIALTLAAAVATFA